MIDKVGSQQMADIKGLCISFLILCILSAFSHSFHVSRIQAWLSWYLYSRSHEAAIKVSNGPGSHLGLAVLFQAYMVVGKFHFLPAIKFVMVCFFKFRKIVSVIRKGQFFFKDSHLIKSGPLVQFPIGMQHTLNIGVISITFIGPKHIQGVGIIQAKYIRAYKLGVYLRIVSTTLLNIV